MQQLSGYSKFFALTWLASLNSTYPDSSFFWSQVIVFPSEDNREFLSPTCALMLGTATIGLRYPHEPREAKQSKAWEVQGNAPFEFPFAFRIVKATLVSPHNPRLERDPSHTNVSPHLLQEGIVILLSVLLIRSLTAHFISLVVSAEGKIQLSLSIPQHPSGAPLSHGGRTRG